MDFKLFLAPPYRSGWAPVAEKKAFSFTSALNIPTGSCQKNDGRAMNSGYLCFSNPLCFGRRQTRTCSPGNERTNLSLYARMDPPQHIPDRLVQILPTIFDIIGFPV